MVVLSVSIQFITSVYCFTKHELLIIFLSLIFFRDYVVKNRYRDYFAVTLIGVGFYVGKKW